jgi:2-oxoglutarate ferredoxin oxidoreductase subunit beta
VAEEWRADAVQQGHAGHAPGCREAALKIVDVVDGDWQAAGVIVHDVTNRSVAHMLVELPMDVPGGAGRDL